MTRIILVTALLTGCLADGEPVVSVMDNPQGIEEVRWTDFDDVDVCGLAASLAHDNVCSLICDPDTMAGRLADEQGGGRCYQLRCELGENVVSVGVCVP